MGKVKRSSNTRNNSSPKENKSVKMIENEKNQKNKTKKSHILKLSNSAIGTRKTISKKEKEKLKKQKVSEKIELTKCAFREDTLKRKRQKTAIVGDLKPLLDSLPSLDELLTLRDKSSKTGIASIDRNIMKTSKTKTGRKHNLLHQKTEKMLDRFDLVQKIWKNPEYQKNPRKLIAEQIKHRRQTNIQKANKKSF